jgi:hypothetical protein
VNKICNFSGKRKVTDGLKLPSADKKIKYFAIYVGIRKHPEDMLWLFRQSNQPRLRNDDSSQFQLEDSVEKPHWQATYIWEKK